jgi:mono/diheme cytochrome c family protein
MTSIMWKVSKRVVSGICGMAIMLAGCSFARHPTVPVEVLLTPAAMPTPVADGEAAPRRPPDVFVGSAIYEQKCASCHGPDGQGDGPSAAQIKAQGRMVPSLVAPARVRAVRPSEWHDVITDGRIQNLMPPFRSSLNAQERWDVQAYLWALATTPQQIESGRQIYQAQCAACHGERGETVVGEGMLRRALNDPFFLADRSLLEIASLMLSGAPHAGIALGEAERFQVADFVRSLSYRYADPVAIRASELAGDGVITLRAVNRTPNGGAIANLPVTLRAYDTNGEVLSRTAMLDEDGFVTFTNLPTRADYFYQAELDYSGGRFYAPPVQFPITGSQTISNFLPVFETTTDPSAISISEMHVFVQNIAPDTVTIAEFYWFDNAGDRAYIGEDGPDGRRRTLKLSVPEEAQNLRFDGLGLGQRFFREGNVVYDTDAVVPGQRAAQVTMLYELPYRDSRLIERKVFYPAQYADVIVPALEGLGTPFTVTGSLVSQGVQPLSSGNVAVFASSRPIPAGESLSFELRGNPLARPPVGGDGVAVGAGLIALGLTIGLAYLVLSRASTASFGRRNLPQRRRQLLREIAALDDSCALGEIDAESYRQRRAALKAELLDLWEGEGGTALHTRG